MLCPVIKHAYSGESTKEAKNPAIIPIIPAESGGEKMRDPRILVAKKRMEQNMTGNQICKSP